MTESAGSVVVNRYDYDLDWSGRLVERRSYDDADPLMLERRLDSIESTTWYRFELFDGAVASYQVVDQKRRECSGQQTYDQCLASGALSVETTTWEPRTSYWDEGRARVALRPDRSVAKARRRHRGRRPSDTQAVLRLLPRGPLSDSSAERAHGRARERVHAASRADRVRL